MRNFKWLVPAAAAWILAITISSAANSTTSTASTVKLLPGFRVDMIQVPRSFQGVSKESKYSRGLWTLADAKLVLKQFHGKTLTPKASTLVYINSELNFSDHLFKRVWGPNLGHTQAYPLFITQPIVDARPDLGFRNDLDPKGDRPDNDTNNENDFVFLATGYLDIKDPGIYEFAVLNDDGFQFQIEIDPSQFWTLTDSGSEPLHPPQVFNGSLTLKKGLLPFSLVSYEHLEASVIRLLWKKPGSTDWTLVPAEAFQVRSPNLR